MIKTDGLVTIILVSFYSDQQIKKILKQIPSKYNVIVTENSLNEKLKYEIETIYKNVKILIPSCNLGNGAGINLALKNVKTKYAFYIDIDIELKINSIEQLTIVAEQHHGWAVLAPNIINYKYNSDYFIKKNFQKQLSKMRFVEGCALFFNFKEIEQLGFYDSKIFLYYEEDDLFFKYLKNDLDIILCENIFISHKGNSSTDDVYKFEIELNRNWHYMWSKFYYYKKNFSYSKGIKETLAQFIKSIFKLIFFYLINKKKFLVYKNRALGLLNSYLNKPSWRRPNIK